VVNFDSRIDIDSNKRFLLDFHICPAPFGRVCDWPISPAGLAAALYMLLMCPVIQLTRAMDRGPCSSQPLPLTFCLSLYCESTSWVVISS